MAVKPSFFARWGIVILVMTFFFVPFALRGSRMAAQGMKNDVKDWLPKDFEETAWLDWFRQHFISDQFVLVSWEGCHGDANDESFKLFVDKLNPQLPPTMAKRMAEEAAAAKASAATPADDASDVLIKTEPVTMLVQHDFIGNKLGFYLTDNLNENWGGKNERWLRGKATLTPGDKSEAWYYITPEGDLYRWDAVDAPVASLGRSISRRMYGPHVEGTLVASFGPVDGPWYYQDVRRLRAQLFKSVTTGPAVLASLTGEGGELADVPDEALRRLQGTLIGPDGKQTCIVLTLTDAAKQNLHLVLGRGMLGKPRGQLLEMANQCNISDSNLWLGGPPVDNVAIDEEGTITLVRLVGLCAALGVGLSYLCFRSISATIMVFFIGGISAVMSLAFVWWFNSSVDAILMSMPALVYVLGLSGASHIINYYREAVAEHGYHGASDRAIAHAWKPALMCNLTTAIGLVSLVTSELIPIQKFGVFSALGVMATLLVLFTYLPAALYIWPQKPTEKPEKKEASWTDTLLDNLWDRLGSFIVRHHNKVAIACTVIIVAFGFGVTKIRTSVNMLKMFKSDAKIIKDYEHLEAKLGPLVPMEIVISVPKEKLGGNAAAATGEEKPADEAAVAAKGVHKLDFLERMEISSRIQKVIDEEFGATGRQVVGCSTSAASFVRPLPAANGDTLTYSLRKTTGRKLAAHRDQFLKSDYLREDLESGNELWRVSLRIPATKGVDYGILIEELKEAVEPVLSAQQYRDNIVDAMTAAKEKLKGRTTDANSKVGRVLLVGVPEQSLPKPKAKGKGTTDTEETAESTEVTAAVESTPAKIDQTKIFARTLYDLMKIKRYKVGTLVPGKDNVPADWTATLKQFDCIVMVDDVPGWDVATLKELATAQGKELVDVRKHHFVNKVTRGKADPKDRAGSTAEKPLMAVYTGVVPIVYKSQRSLLDSLIESTLWSFLTITPLMMFISRSIGAGAVAMLPNILPVVMVFGGMGWIGMDVDVGSMMTASIALGVAVDDTIHYLTWFRQELDRLGDRKKAILSAYRHCATPTFQAAVISGLGLSIFALSTFTPTQRFGYLMLTILWMGVAAELIFFPALLAGPLGCVFKPRPKAAGAEGHEEDATSEKLVAEAESETIELPDPGFTPGGATPHSQRGQKVSPSTMIRNLRQDGQQPPRKRRG